MRTQINNANTRVKCGPGPRVWSADYPFAGPHFTRATTARAVLLQTHSVYFTKIIKFWPSQIHPRNLFLADKKAF